MYVSKLLSVHRSTSPSTLYSDVVKIPSENRVDSAFGLNAGRADRIQSKTVKVMTDLMCMCRIKCQINNVHFGTFVNPMNSIDTSEQKHIVSKKIVMYM